MKDIVQIKDGDQVTVKGVYSDEANAELDTYIHSKANSLSMEGINIRKSSNETVLALYSLTKVIDKSVLIDPIF